MKLRYKLHWNSNSDNGPFKWVIYDWNRSCPVAYAETRKRGRLICNYLNHLEEKEREKK